MIGLLDPALLLPRQGSDPNRAFTQELDEVLKICRKHNVRLLPIGVYWNDLWSKLGQPLELTLDPSSKRTLQELRKLGASSTEVNREVSAVVWRRGFRQLFGEEALQEDWVERMASAVAIATSFEEPVIMFIRRMLGRNLIIHRVQDSTLDENLRWVLYVRLAGKEVQQISCVHKERNMSERWTCRYDWRLPSEGDGGAYAFVPAEQWWKGATVAFRTIRTKLAWVDRDGNGWARPNIRGGAGYHWDLFINNLPLKEQLRCDHVNIVAFGGPASEGRPGEIHH